MREQVNMFHGPLLLELVGVLLAIGMPSPSPPPQPGATGPCAQGSLAAISDRPGLGRAPATNGAACVVLPNTVVIEAGYRNQETVGAGTQTLTTVPSPTLRVGLRGQNELLFSGLVYSQRTGHDSSSGFLPASGMQDSGVGFKHALRDRPWMQDALNLFVTLPTGYPGNASGFSAGLSTYTLGYSIAFPLSSRVGIAATQNAVLNAFSDSSGVRRRYVMYQPSFTFSYAIFPNLSLLLEDQLSLPNAPGAGTGNRALAGLQCTISPNVVLDAEIEANLLPSAGAAQHAVGAGFTLQP